MDRTRRGVLRAGAATGVSLASHSMLGAGAMATSVDAPDDYEAVLDGMDGEGSALDRYVITDVTELQAMAGEPDAYYELGGDIDATATENWNETDEIRGDYLGQAHKRWYDTRYSPLVEGSVECYLDGEPIDDGEYSVDHEAGELLFDRDPGEDTRWITADYRVREPVRLGFEPVGRRAEPFTGKVDGAGCEIRGLTVEHPGFGVGLFGQSSGTITGVSLGECDVTGRHDVGGLVGVLDRGGIVREAAVDGSVTAEFMAGGIAASTFPDTEIAASYATADVTAESWAGGLVQSNRGTVTDSYAAGTVTADGKTGGLVQRNDGTVTDSYWDVPATGMDESDGGTGVGALGDEPPADDMIGEAAPETLDGLDFVGTWEVSTEGHGYPVLAWEATADETTDGSNGDDGTAGGGSDTDGSDATDDSDGAAGDDLDDETNGTSEGSRDDDGTADPADDGLPGFGIVATIAGLGGSVHLLNRRRNEE